MANCAPRAPGSARCRTPKLAAAGIEMPHPRDAVARYTELFAGADTDWVLWPEHRPRGGQGPTEVPLALDAALPAVVVFSACGRLLVSIAADRQA